MRYDPLGDEPVVHLTKAAPLAGALEVNRMVSRALAFRFRDTTIDLRLNLRTAQRWRRVCWRLERCLMEVGKIWTEDGLGGRHEVVCPQVVLQRTLHKKLWMKIAW